VNPSVEASTPVNARDVAHKMKFDYSRGVKDATTKNLESVCALCGKLEQPHLDAGVLIKETADIVAKLFAIERVAIGVRDPVDKLYMYWVVVGLDDETAEGYQALTYTRDQLLNPGTYPSYEISARTRLFLAEEHPYAQGEEFTYRRPGLIGMKRRTLTDSLEADYLDFLFFDQNGDILGFIETSGTRLRKLPDTTTIKWIELVAGILGAALRK